MITMINLREIFNPNYNFIFIIITIISFILTVISTKDLKYIGKILIYTSIFLIILSLIIPIFINILNNNIIKIFLTPIINNIKVKILIPSIIITLIGFILVLTNKRTRAKT